MAESGFPLTAGELAEALGGTLDGPAGVVLRGVAGLREADAGDLTFLSDPRYNALAADTRAGALLVRRDWAGTAPCTLIRVDDPARTFAGWVARVAPPPFRPAAGVHPSAVVAADAVLGNDVSIGPHGVIESGVVVGDRTVCHAGVYLGYGARVGRDVVLYPHVSVREHCTIGDRTVIHNGTVIGSDGFGYDRNADGSWTKIPQVGSVAIGADVEIGANTTIDRARFGRTVIGDGVKIDNLVQVAHNVRVGEHTAIAGAAALAGSTILGRRVRFGGQATTAGHLVIGDDAVIVGCTTVFRDVPPGAFMMGFAATPAARYKRMHAVMERLPELAQRVKALERYVAALENKKAAP